MARQSNSYWELEEYSLLGPNTTLYMRARALGCGPEAKDWTVEDLSAWLRRRDLQLADYDNCLNDELATFIRDRLIPIFPATPQEPIREKKKPCVFRRRAIEALEDADHALSFHRFLDLPPELRNRVYELHFEDFPRALKLPAKPPIACTSHFVQQEALPVLYANHEIILPFKMVANRTHGDRWKYEGSSVPSQHKHRNTKSVIETAHTALFLQQMRPEHFQYLRRITIRIPNEESSTLSDEEEEDFQELIIRITLGKAAGSYCVTVVDHDPAFDDDAEWTGSYEDKVKSEVEAVLDKVAARGGMLRLTANDIHSIRPAITRGYEKFNDWVGSTYWPY
ncbi:hypothetical protein BDY17DRAFT_327235 [Neohortaea acidophila]|uniref:Uncharacterized protein n=1 Tax=Neohortaea acidophila TaxID=245834 RepID=A0A6A6PJP2_9PEZI|nr:uncharacterized protein BDY17DRAFT_327235 [Neohortaea acidophila]KAF2480270.1 hypothetical protein BDY17DRAFT_327235 [Neohortaea acidophila]